MTFITNRWVRGDDFLGRRDLLARIEKRGAKPCWVRGNRRVGKTSLLRQIEWLCRKGDWPNRLALYWDLQGAGSPEGLKDAFLEGLEDADGVAEKLGLDIDALEECGFSEAINKFRRKVKALPDTQFLLLMDECEELVDVAKSDPQVLSTFRKLSQTPSLALIMAGSQRMMDLDESNSRTSPFLPDFLPPLTLGPFSRQTAIALLRRNDVPEETAARIYDLGFGNPHLTQAMGEHCLRLGDLDAALAELKRDRVCHYFFKSNFQCLPQPMRDWHGSGRELESLSGLASDSADFAHAVSASLIRPANGGVEISPLLRMVVTGQVPGAEAPAVTPPPRAAEAPAPPEAESPGLEPPELILLEALRARGSWLSALDENALEATDPADAIAAAGNPAALNLLAAQDESPEKIHAVLDGASPEYVMGAEPDERTAVYLAGLWLHRRAFGASLFREIEDPWARAGAIADRDPPIRPEDAVHPLPPKLAMVILRCLKADPAQRYKSLAVLEADLRATQP